MSDKWKCGCGCHVTTGAFTLACLGMLFFFMATPALFLLPSVIQRVHVGLTLAITLISCLPIIIGQITGKRRPWIYLPYLILHGIAFVLNFLSAIFVLLVKLQVVIPSDFINELYYYSLKDATQGVDAVAIVIHIVFSLLGLLVNWWLLSIVYRAYKFVKEFELEGNPA